MFINQETSVDHLNYVHPTSTWPYCTASRYRTLYCKSDDNPY